MVLGPMKKKTEVRTERAADKARRDEETPADLENTAEPVETAPVAAETTAPEQQTVA